MTYSSTIICRTTVLGGDMPNRAKFAAGLFAAVMLTGCGGGHDRPDFDTLVSFGDSLSDVGTYAVGTVKTLGGGKYTINAPDAKNWIELMAARLELAAPCAAQTGLEGEAALGFSAPVTNVPGCTAYGQGGARVTNPIGVGNKGLGGANVAVGQLTVPIVTQIQNHLARVGRFSKHDAVFVQAGGNDVFINAAAVAGGGDPAAAVAAMSAAGSEFAGYIRNLIVERGARYVTVVNLPDIATTPFGLAQDAQTRTLIDTMVATFNAQLQLGLVGTKVLLVDAYAVNRDQSTNPAKYGITNATTPACDLSPVKNPLGSSLICTRANLIPGVVDNFEFADTVHPTPFGYKLLADAVIAAMEKRDWL
jgi:outer membrane lipase/esterase